MIVLAEGIVATDSVYVTDSIHDFVCALPTEALSETVHTAIRVLHSVLPGKTLNFLIYIWPEISW